VDIAAIIIAVGSALIAGVFGWLNRRQEGHQAEKVAELNTALTQAQAWGELVHTLREEVDRLKEQVHTLQGLVATQAGTIKALEREVSRLEYENYMLRAQQPPPAPPLPI
jgi:polyhydroxyalkanoate synthesis regulator phasin